jgi:hypothetical protein
MTSFSLLKFKFTQIFLMGQNGFSKMTELSVNVTEFSRIIEYGRVLIFLKIVAPFTRRIIDNAVEFWFLKDYCSFHMSNTILLNFLNFFAPHKFSNTGSNQHTTSVGLCQSLQP